MNSHLSTTIRLTQLLLLPSTDGAADSIGPTRCNGGLAAEVVRNTHLSLRVATVHNDFVSSPTDDVFAYLVVGN